MDATVEPSEVVTTESFEPLFEDEAPQSEAELRGEETEDASTEEPTTDPGQELASSNDEALQRELDALKAENYALRHQPLPEPVDQWKGFKVLSDEEFEQLRDEDPDEAIVYLRKEGQFQAYNKKRRTEQEYTQAFEHQVLEDAWERIAEVIPNALERDRPEVQEAITELNEFALENGLTDQQLAILTNPSTRVIVKGSDGRERVAMLGDTAAAVVKLIGKYHKAVKPMGRTSPSPQPTKQSGEYTEDEWGKLPEAERRSLLGG